ncbi:MAG TPA: cobalamin-binding protein [Steroidobacteraceae bacterium]|nr:cobalamin-binding protein [Steroidobacteraceae bacterium]
MTRRLLLLLVLIGLAAAAEDRPLRIVSLAPHLTELVFAAGAGEMLVGTVAYSDYPAQALDIERIGDAWRVDLERLVALQPDLVFAWPSGTPEQTLQRLSASGLEVVLLPTDRLSDVAAALRRIGELTGHAAEAGAAASRFEAEVDGLRERHAADAAVSVFVQLDDQPLYTINGRHLISEVVELCGGRNVFGELPQLAPAVSRESVLARDPQVILTTDDAIADPRREWSRWQSMQAVRAGTIYSVPADTVSRATPRLTEGIAAVCEALAAARIAYR